jgi:hypothetical protein
MDDEFRQAVVDNVMRLWVQPEIDRRKDAGLLDGAFVLDRAQVIMNVGAAATVRLNEETRVEYRAQVVGQEPDTVEGRVIVQVHVAFNLPADEDPNAGYLFIINVGGTWHPSDSA